MVRQSIYGELDASLLAITISISDLSRWLPTRYVTNVSLTCHAKTMHIHAVKVLLKGGG